MKLFYAALIPVTLLSSISLSAQNRSKIKYGDVKVEDFNPTVYSVDSSATAVYLYDVGASFYEGNNSGGFSVVYNRHARIRLMNKNSFDEMAKLEIELYKNGSFEEKLEDLDAATYNIENGKVVATKVDKGSLFKDKSENGTTVKFTFPNIKEGSIVEYDYKVSSPSFMYIEPWRFQGAYPRLWSEYSVAIPAFFDFVTLKKGYIDYVVDSADVTRQSYIISDGAISGTSASSTRSYTSNMLYHKWASANVPPLKEEEFTTTLNNYLAKIEFQLSTIRHPDRGVEPVLQDWYKVAENLMKDENFGKSLTNDNNWLNDDVKKAVAGAKDDEEKAKNIFNFVRDNYTCIDGYARYLSQPLKKTYQAHKGNVADINMLLAAMLKNIGFEVHPVLLSTREHGKPYEIYPIMNQFNYMVAQAKKEDKSYLLDASDPALGFNHLPAECYNGSARIIAEMPSLIDLSADSLTESKLTTVFVINESDSLSGSFSTQLGNEESQSVRRQLKKTTKEEYFKDIKKAYPSDFALANAEIDSLKIPEEPVTVKYDLKFSPGDEDMFYFSPMLGEAYKENPFKAAERLYPVEMPACFNETYILNMEIPKGYTVEELPKSTRVMLNENEGMFEYIIGASGGRIQLRCRTVTKKANFEPDDYATLRDFFAFIVKKEAEQIVFKKQ